MRVVFDCQRAYGKLVLPKLIEILKRRPMRCYQLSDTIQRSKRFYEVNVERVLRAEMETVV